MITVNRYKEALAEVPTVEIESVWTEIPNYVAS